MTDKTEHQSMNYAEELVIEYAQAVDLRFNSTCSAEWDEYEFRRLGVELAILNLGRRLMEQEDG